MNAARVVRPGVALAAAALILAALILAAAPAAPAAARAVGPVPSRAELAVPKAACGVAGVLNKAIGIACGALSNGGALIRGGKQLLHGNVGGAVTSLLGGGGAVGSTVGTAAGSAIGLAAIGAWVIAGAGAVLHETATALGDTTRPQLASTWFSSTYWRMAAIATMLTLPFLFAATVQAALRSDVALLARAALGYLPLAILSIAIAAPLATLLLAASDEMCSLISAAAGSESTHVIAAAGVVVAGLTALARSPFLAFLVALFAIGAAFTLWVELLLRDAAVYVVVLMLPLAFAALAWPARRIWAVRAVEILVALILSKFAIVAVLSLGGAAISASVGHLGVSGLMAGTVLIMLAALSPWVLLRFVPLAELAAGAAGALRGELRTGGHGLATRAAGEARSADDWVSRTTSGMKRDAERGMPQLDGAAPATAADGPASPAEAEPGAGSRDEAAAPAPDQPAAPAPDEPAAPAPTERRDPAWSERPVLELGPNFGDTVVWPHEDAE